MHAIIPVATDLLYELEEQYCQRNNLTGMTTQSPLVEAISKRDFEQAHTLLTAGERLPDDLQDHHLRQLYDQVLGAKAYAVFDQLIDNGSIVTDVYEYEKFDKSIFKNLLDVVRYQPAEAAFLEYLPTVLPKFQNINDEVSGQTLLSYALEIGVDPAVIRILIAAGVETDFRNTAEENLLSQVVNNNALRPEKRLPYLDILLEAGVAINEPNIVGKTALHMAVERSNKEMVSWLLEQGANPNEPDKKGQTPFYYALVHLLDPQMYELLASREPADFSLLNSEGESPFLGYLRMLRQVSPREIGLLKRLLDDGADLQQTAPYYSKGKSAIDWIAEKPADILKTVLEKDGFDINGRDEEGNTILHLVARIDSNYEQNVAKETYKKVKLLLEAGADATITNDKDETPMMLAAKDNLKAKTVELLLSAK